MAEQESDKHGVEVERLRRELVAVREQQAATSQVLTALGRSATDLEAILGTVVEGARSLCRADVAQIHLADGAVYRLARSCGLSPEGVDFMSRNPVGNDRGSLIGRVGLTGRTQQISDVLDDPEYGRFELQRLAGLRTVLGVPMVLDDELVGVLLVWRNKVDPFGNRDADVLTTFAAQAAIAIRQIDLRRTLVGRSQELARNVEQLEALAGIGQAVSSTLDLDEVLATIVTHAVQLSGTDGGSMLEFDDTAQEFHVRAAIGTSDELLGRLRGTRIGLHDTLIGRAAKGGRPQQVADLREAGLDPHLRRLHEAGWRSVVAVPVLRKGRIVGALVVRRKTPGPFSVETCDLLETLAGQSALAIVNARLFRELERKSAELADASQHKSEFLASMSHELRTPLNAVIGFSEVLLERMFGEINERQEEYLRDIWNSGKHLLELLNDILDLSKVEAGHMQLEPSEFVLADALEYGLSLVRERAARHAIDLELLVDSNVATIVADELRIKQVVLNLLSNAVKFTPDGGRVSVRAGSHDDEVTVTVTDNGVGVERSDQARIFESFQQGGRAAPKTEGTGLGLTLSKRIVELHGGRIWVESEVGVGSTFGFTVPVHRASVPSEAMFEAPDIDRRSGPTVVVVEDDRNSMELLTVYLEGAGVAVVPARDGEEGLDLVRKLLPTGVVLDIRLPKLDGWDLLALLKADALTARIPVVVVSMVDERGKGFALGAAEYLVKPVSHDEVISALSRVTVLPDRQRLVLAVDDDPLAVDLVRAVLEPDGWTLIAAASGTDGVALARARQPAVVLLDLLMPGMDGFSVVDALRRDHLTRDVPVVVLTSKTMTREEKERLHGQISHIVAKSEFDPKDFVDLIRNVTGHRDALRDQHPAGRARLRPRPEAGGAGRRLVDRDRGAGRAGLARGLGPALERAGGAGQPPLAREQRRVGGVEQLAGLGAVVGEDRDTDARREHDLARGDPLQGLLDSARQALGLLAVGLGRDHRELVPALAEDRVLGSDLEVDHRADDREQQVADQVALGLVDLLEVVEVEAQQRELAVAALVTRGLVPQSLDQRAVIPDAGEAVLGREPAVGLAARFEAAVSRPTTTAVRTIPGPAAKAHSRPSSTGSSS